MFRGALTALITPFTKDGQVDEKSFCDLVEWQITEGINGLVPVGTTGESPTLTHDEHKKIIELCVATANKRVPVVAGAGSNSTREAIELALFAQEAGADGVLIVTPYYNKPNQKGLYAHFSAVAQSINIPLIIYNIPGRSVIDMSEDTMAALALNHDNIVGVKDATAKIERASMQRLACREGFILLSGDDNTALGFNAQGGCGCISVVSNVAPRLAAQLQQACQDNDYAKAIEINDRLMPLNHALFIEPNPAGIKYAAERLGIASQYVRKPLVALDDSTKVRIDSALKHAGLLG